MGVLEAVHDTWRSLNIHIHMQRTGVIYTDRPNAADLCVALYPSQQSNCLHLCVPPMQAGKAVIPNQAASALRSRATSKVMAAGGGSTEYPMGIE